MSPHYDYNQPVVRGPGAFGKKGGGGGGGGGKPNRLGIKTHSRSYDLHVERLGKGNTEGRRNLTGPCLNISLARAEIKRGMGKGNKKGLVTRWRGRLQTKRKSATAGLKGGLRTGKFYYNSMPVTGRVPLMWVDREPRSKVGSRKHPASQEPHAAPYEAYEEVSEG